MKYIFSSDSQVKEAIYLEEQKQADLYSTY